MIGRSLILVDGLSVDGLGSAKDVRELLNEDRRLLMLKSLRTPDARLKTRGGDELSTPLVSFISLLSGLSLSFSLSDDGYAPGIFSGVVGCEDNGPPRGIGGSLTGV